MLFQKKLSTIFDNHKGKVSDKWYSYIDAYSKEFDYYRTKKINLLEIGPQNCGSLEIWSKYFKKADLILGTDIEPIDTLTFNDNRIHTCVCDSIHLSDNHYLKEYKFDIMIDDASHLSKHIIINFLNLFPLLREGGVYVVEDLACSYWKKFNDLEFKRSMDFFSYLVNFINHQHWTLEYENEFIKNFFHKLPIKIDFETLRKSFKMIHNIKFYNSMCFIYKGHISNHVGIRAARGNATPIIKPGNEDSEYIKKISN